MQKNTLNSDFSKTEKERLNIMLEDIVVKAGETTIYRFLIVGSKKVHVCYDMEFTSYISFLEKIQLRS